MTFLSRSDQIRFGLGTVTYQPDQVVACMRGLDEMSCVELASSDLDFIDLCPLFGGTVADGDDCTSDVECETPPGVCGPNGLCNPDDLCCVRQCSPPAPLRGDCTSLPCQPGDHCVALVCRSGAADSPCQSTSDCDVGLWCGPTGTCVAEIESGAGCTEDDECPAAETCLGNDLDGATGGTCGRADRAGDDCDGNCFGFACVQPDPALLGTCTPLAGDKESCADIDSTGSLRCEPVDSICVPRGDVDAECDDSFDDCRLGLFCSTEVTGEMIGTCEERLPVEGACTSGDHCESGLCGPGSQTCEAFPGCYP